VVKELGEGKEKVEGVVVTVGGAGMGNVGRLAEWIGVEVCRLNVHCCRPRATGVRVSARVVKNVWGK